MNQKKQLKRAWKAFAKAHPLTAAHVTPFYEQHVTSFPTPRAWGSPGIGKSGTVPTVMLDEFQPATLYDLLPDPHNVLVHTGTREEDKSFPGIGKSQILNRISAFQHRKPSKKAWKKFAKNA